ncbi:MAG: dihydropteroate synthase [Verrucomicrobia bacterium]|nr:dihydropteroate synthase [Verrucomicrobiota bacterium]
MGIVNVTPDSFSDGGQFLEPEAALAEVQRQIAEGADVVDIGGESSRPGADPVSEAEECRRVLPVLEALAGRVAVPLSIDTQKPAVARAALAAGASIVNDVAAHRADPAMWEVVAAAGAGYVCMHMQGSPRTMQQQPHYEDVVREVGQFFAERLGRLAASGVGPRQVVLDVGLGFGKTLEHNLRLLARLRSFRKFQRPLLVGASRKSFLGNLLGAEVEARLPGSLACACWAVGAGAQMLRVHDVGATCQAVRLFEALQTRK